MAAKPMLRSLARRAVKLSAASFDRVRPPGRGVVVLLYHRVGRRSELEIDLPTDLFEAQMAELSARGRLTTLDEALDALEEPAPPQRDPVVVTFDDGTADFADVALPILVRHHVPVTLYLATDFVEHNQLFPGNAAPLSWAALRDGLSTGLLTVGSHTHTHAVLDRLDESAAGVELDRSLDLIGERLEVHASHFAYPKAVLGSPAAQRAVWSRFRSAALGGAGPNRYGRTDRYRLARSPVQGSDGMRWFRHKAAGGMAVEYALRRVLDRRRYAGAIT